MCGIIGYIGQDPAKPILLDGLRRLEYRGYDSAGIALHKGADDFLVIRQAGRVQELEKLALESGLTETTGIAHTRWATHGVPNVVNAHPHRAGKLVLVHNGIIENHSLLKEELTQKGVHFHSQTDTEVFAQLIEESRKELCQTRTQNFDSLSSAEKIQLMLDALGLAMKQARGHYAILFMIQGLPEVLMGAQNGAPLVAGHCPSGTVIGSDLQAVIPYTREVSFLPTGILFVATQKEIQYLDPTTKKPIPVSFEKIQWSTEQVEKGGYDTFMMKEIFEQPRVVADTLSGRLPEKPGQPFAWDHLKAHDVLWKNVKKVYLIACGTSYHAALVAKYYFENWAELPTEVDLASEFRYRSPILEPGTVVGVISQSGETADTLAALRLATSRGVSTFSICNVPASSIVRESSFQYPTKAGPEIGVASTKAFTSQLTLLLALAQDVAQLRGKLRAVADSDIQILAKLPHFMEVVLRQANLYLEAGKKLVNKKAILFVGRGFMYPIALEGALKMKEITCRHAEGYAAGELKHGPIALVDSDVAAVVLAPSGHLFEKTVSNLEEIRARGATMITLGEEGQPELKKISDIFFGIPAAPTALTPILYTLPLQLLAIGMATELGCDIDKPRNLAKSVTVE